MNESIKTLGVSMSPTLSWDDECMCVKNESMTSIKKIMRVEIKMYQGRMCVNVLML